MNWRGLGLRQAVCGATNGGGRCKLPDLGVRARSGPVPVGSVAVLLSGEVAGRSDAGRLDLQAEQLRHGQGDDCSPTPAPSARSDDSSKLCGTACAERRAARAPLPQPPACPTTRPRPHCCRRPATRRRLSRCFSRPRNRNAPRAWRPRHLHRPSQKALPRPAPA
ncbi:hypothetical protein VPH35_010675 [Triticum aestivum]